jgi:subtilisin family serine protease
MPKMSNDLLRRLGAAPDQRVRVILRYRQRLPALVTRSASMRMHTYTLLPMVALEVNAHDLRLLAESDETEQIWLDLPVHIFLDASIPLIGVPQVWADAIRGRGIVVAVVDTGVDASHPDLLGRVTLTQDFSGQGFVDNHGHGTHVAGIVAGNGVASNGLYTGVAPEASIIAAKVLRGDGSGSMSDVMAGVDWAAQNGAQVINLSLGADENGDGNDALSQICDAAVARGVVVCVAAGNAGPGPSTLGTPGCARDVITVGASDQSDNVAGFSSRGPTTDNRVKPDLCFPGVAIAACRAAGTSMGQTINDYYTAASGTSMATPHCAGACALLLQADPTRTPQAIKELLMGSAKDLQTDIYAQGSGRAQVNEAYLGNTTPKPPEPPPPSGDGCALALRRMADLGRLFRR